MQEGYLAEGKNLHDFTDLEKIKMKYENVVHAQFVKRQNRFIAYVHLDGKTEMVHVKNTGRLGELLLPGADVVLQRTDNPNRKTQYDLISVYKENLGWVNIDSQVTNKIVLEWLKNQEFTFIKPEYKYGNSRLDFYMEKDGEKYLMEVKGCTLEIDGKGYFPDAKSSRAVRHERELIDAVSKGYHSITAFVIAMEGVEEVYPHVKKDPKFARALQEAKEAGVEVWHFSCKVTEDTIAICSVK